jgi:glyceraldehyde-3-phosphate dehydrogenase (NAD(P))
LQQNPFIAVTQKMSANVIFAYGRDYGYYGRILNNTVIALPTLHLSADGKELHGFCFTPQDGNSLISSVAAALWLLDPNEYTEQLQALSPYFFSEI